MIQLPLVLFIVMAELSIGAFAVLFVLDWLREVKRNFLVTYGLIYIVLTGLTYLFQQNFSTPDLLNTFPQLDKAWTGYLSLPLLLFFLLMLPYNLFLWLDKKEGAGNPVMRVLRSTTLFVRRGWMCGRLRSWCGAGNSRRPALARK